MRLVLSFQSSCFIILHCNYWTIVLLTGWPHSSFVVHCSPYYLNSSNFLTSPLPKTRLVLLWMFGVWDKEESSCWALTMFLAEWWALMCLFALVPCQCRISDLSLLWPERRLPVFLCRLCVYYLRWGRGSGFCWLGHLLGFPIQCKQTGRAALPWEHSHSFERRANFWQTRCWQHMMDTTQPSFFIFLNTVFKMTIFSHHLNLLPRVPSTRILHKHTQLCVFLPGEGRGIQLIADLLLNHSQDYSWPRSSCMSSSLFWFFKRSRGRCWISKWISGFCHTDIPACSWAIFRRDSLNWAVLLALEPLGAAGGGLITWSIQHISGCSTSLRCVWPYIEMQVCIESQVWKWT